MVSCSCSTGQVITKKCHLAAAENQYGWAKSWANLGIFFFILTKLPWYFHFLIHLMHGIYINDWFFIHIPNQQTEICVSTCVGFSYDEILTAQQFCAGVQTVLLYKRYIIRVWIPKGWGKSSVHGFLRGGKNVFRDCQGGGQNFNARDFFISTGPPCHK